MKRFSKITTTQLARICGVSQGTVDRALHDRPGVSAETRAKILTVAREYDYLPNIKGEKGNSMLIGVVLYDLYNEYFSKLAMSLVRESRRAGFSPIFQFSGKDLREERRALEYFDYVGVDGIVLFSAGSDSVEYENYLRQIHRPLVLIGNRMFNLPYVGIDDRQAMTDVTLRLAEKAGGEVVYYAPSLRKHLHRDNAQILRLEGFRDAINRLGKTGRTVTDPKDLGGSDTVVCSTDTYAVAALKQLHFPKNLKISGFDNISLLNCVTVPVLTVDYSTDRIARECVNYIIGTPYDPNVPYELVLSDPSQT